MARHQLLVGMWWGAVLGIVVWARSRVVAAVAVIAGGWALFPERVNRAMARAVGNLDSGQRRGVGLPEGWFSDFPPVLFIAVAVAIFFVGIRVAEMGRAARDLRTTSTTILRNRASWRGNALARLSVIAALIACLGAAFAVRRIWGG